MLMMETMTLTLTMMIKMTGVDDESGDDNDDPGVYTYDYNIFDVDNNDDTLVLTMMIETCAGYDDDDDWYFYVLAYYVFELFFFQLSTFFLLFLICMTHMYLQLIYNPPLTLVLLREGLYQPP